MIKIAIHIESNEDYIRAYLEEELTALLNRLEKDIVNPPRTRMDIAFNPHSKEQVKSHDEVPSIIK